MSTARIVRNLNATAKDGQESECPQLKDLSGMSTAKHCQESECPHAKDGQEAECPQPRIVRNLNVHSQGLSGI